MNYSSPIIKIVENADPSEIIDVLQDVDFTSLDENELKAVLSLITRKDKGITNNLSMMLSYCGDPRIFAQLAEYTSSEDIAARNLAGEILINIGADSAEPLLQYLNAADNFDDQKFVIDLLGLIKNKIAVKPILDILKKTPDANVKLSCIEALGNLEAEEAVEPAMKCYDENEIFKPTVNEALGKIASKEALEFMLLKYPAEDELTKYSIIESLGIIGDIDTFFFLVSELNNVPKPLTWIIIKSLQQLADKFSLDIPFEETIQNIFLNTIYEAPADSKKAAIYLLKDFHDKEILVACLTALGKDFDLDEALKARFLENKEQTLLCFPQFLKMDLKNRINIMSLLSDLIDNLEKPIGSILNGFNLRGLIDSLSNYLTHSDEEARRLAMSLLFKIDPIAAIMFTDKMLEDDNIWNKIMLIDNLSEIEDKSVLQTLEALSKDPEIMVANRAKETLKQKNLTYIS